MNRLTGWMTTVAVLAIAFLAATWMYTVGQAVAAENDGPSAATNVYTNDRTHWQISKEKALTAWQRGSEGGKSNHMIQFYVRALSNGVAINYLDQETNMTKGWSRVIVDRWVWDAAYTVASNANPAWVNNDWKLAYKTALQVADTVLPEGNQ